MKTIVQLSDLHFGKVDARLVAPLIDTVNQLEPDLVVISGDLTQRAKPEQFKEAKEFLAQLPQPQLVIPGNHDIPLYNVAARLLSGLRRYKRYISDDLAPTYHDDAVAVAGINTARSLSLINGSVTHGQISKVADFLSAAPREAVRIVVSHHPFDFTEALLDRWLVKRADMALTAFSKSRVDILLGGHFHLSYVGDTARRYKINGYKALVISAGSAISTRQRGETNSFNVLRVFPDKVAVERHAWNPTKEAYLPNGLWRFKKTSEGWEHIPFEARPSETQRSRAQEE